MLTICVLCDLLLSSMVSVPSEARLFSQGVNNTSKGTYIFDEASANSVMQAYEKAGVDVLIDLEHLSLEDPASSVGFRTDAVGWCKLDMRDGELWAVDIRWTPEGIERLECKKQRYFSPAFLADKTGRITDVLNVALVAMPATEHAQELVAASKERSTMDPTIVSPEAAPAEAKPKGKVAAILESMKAVRTAIDDTEKVIKGKDIDAIFDAMKAARDVMTSFVEALDAFNGASAPAESPAESPVETAEQAPAADAEDTKKQVECSASSAAPVTTLSSEDYLELVRLRAEMASIDASRRNALVRQLVELGAETPATAYVNGAIAPYLAAMPTEALAARAQVFAALGKGLPVKAPVASPTQDNVPGRLRGKVDPEKYAAIRASIAARKG